jgi:gamma-glutamyltranspeptidase/glutathione hydrolase
MVYRKANGEKGTLDYREKRLGGYKDMFLDAKGNVIPGKHQISSLKFQER